MKISHAIIRNGISRGILEGTKVPEKPEYVPNMTHPYGKNWDAPKNTEVLIYPDRAEMTQESFDKLLDYAGGCPTAVYEGKMYRKDNYLHWWTSAEDPNKCKDNVRPIKVVERIILYSEARQALWGASIEFEEGSYAHELLPDSAFTDSGRRGTIVDGIYPLLGVNSETVWQIKNKKKKEWSDIPENIYNDLPDVFDYRTVLRLIPQPDSEQKKKEQYQYFSEQYNEWRNCDREWALNKPHGTKIRVEGTEVSELTKPLQKRCGYGRETYCREEKECDCPLKVGVEENEPETNKAKALEVLDNLIDQSKKRFEGVSEGEPTQEQLWDLAISQYLKDLKVHELSMYECTHRLMEKYHIQKLKP